MAQGLFWWVRAQDWSPHAPGISKNANGPIGIPLIRGTSGTGQYPPKGVKAWGEGPLKPKEISRYRDTHGQIRAEDNTAGRPKCYLAPGEVQTDIDLPLWQRNLSVLITVRRVHYGEMGKAPITPLPQAFYFVKVLLIFFSFWVDHQRVGEFPFSP